MYMRMLVLNDYAHLDQVLDAWSELSVSGHFLAVIDPAFLLVGVMGLLMTGMGLIGNLARFDRRLWVIEMDGLALIVFYIAGLWLLCARRRARVASTST